MSAKNTQTDRNSVSAWDILYHKSSLLAAFVIPLALTASCNKRHATDDQAANESALNARAPQRAINSSIGTEPETSYIDKKSPESMVSKMLKGGYSAEDLRDLEKSIRRKSAESGESATEYAAKLAMNQPSESKKSRSVALLFRAFVTIEDRSAFVFSIPAGKDRSKAVSLMTGEVLKSRNRSDFDKLYQIAPLGRDRSSIAAAIAGYDLRNSGAVECLGYIGQLEMPEERYHSLCRVGLRLAETLSSLEDSERDRLQDMIDSIVGTLTPSDADSFRIMVSAFAKTVENSKNRTR